MSVTTRVRSNSLDSTFSSTKQQPNEDDDGNDENSQVYDDMACYIHKATKKCRASTVSTFLEFEEEDVSYSQSEADDVVFVRPLLPVAKARDGGASLRLLSFSAMTTKRSSPSPKSAGHSKWRKSNCSDFGTQSFSESATSTTQDETASRTEDVDASSRNDDIHDRIRATNAAFGASANISTTIDERLPLQDDHNDRSSVKEEPTPETIDLNESCTSVSTVSLGNYLSKSTNISREQVQLGVGVDIDTKSRQSSAVQSSGMLSFGMQSTLPSLSDCSGNDQSDCITSMSKVLDGNQSISLSKVSDVDGSMPSLSLLSAVDGSMPSLSLLSAVDQQSMPSLSTFSVTDASSSLSKLSSMRSMSKASVAESSMPSLSIMSKSEASMPSLSKMSIADASMPSLSKMSASCDASLPSLSQMSAPCDESSLPSLAHMSVGDESSMPSLARMSTAGDISMPSLAKHSVVDDDQSISLSSLAKKTVDSVEGKTLNEQSLTLSALVRNPVDSRKGSKETNAEDGNSNRLPSPQVGRFTPVSYPKETESNPPPVKNINVDKIGGFHHDLDMTSITFDDASTLLSSSLGSKRRYPQNDLGASMPYLGVNHLQTGLNSSMPNLNFSLNNVQSTYFNADNRGEDEGGHMATTKENPNVKPLQNQKLQERGNASMKLSDFFVAIPKKKDGVPSLSSVSELEDPTLESSAHSRSLRSSRELSMPSLSSVSKNNDLSNHSRGMRPAFNRETSMPSISEIEVSDHSRGGFRAFFRDASLNSVPSLRSISKNSVGQASMPSLAMVSESEVYENGSLSRDQGTPESARASFRKSKHDFSFDPLSLERHNRALSPIPSGTGFETIQHQERGSEMKQNKFLGKKERCASPPPQSPASPPKEKKRNALDSKSSKQSGTASSRRDDYKAKPERLGTKNKGSPMIPIRTVSSTSSRVVDNPTDVSNNRPSTPPLERPPTPPKPKQRSSTTSYIVVTRPNHYTIVEAPRSKSEDYFAQDEEDDESTNNDSMDEDEKRRLRDNFQSTAGCHNSAKRRNSGVQQDTSHANASRVLSSAMADDDLIGTDDCEDDDDDDSALSSEILPPPSAARSRTWAATDDSSTKKNKTKGFRVGQRAAYRRAQSARQFHKRKSSLGTNNGAEYNARAPSRNKSLDSSYTYRRSQSAKHMSSGSDLSATGESSKGTRSRERSTGRNRSFGSASGTSQGRDGYRRVQSARNVNISTSQSSLDMIYNDDDSSAVSQDLRSRREDRRRSSSQNRSYGRAQSARHVGREPGSKSHVRSRSKSNLYEKDAREDNNKKPMREKTNDHRKKGQRKASPRPKKSHSKSSSSDRRSKSQRSRSSSSATSWQRNEASIGEEDEIRSHRKRRTSRDSLDNSTHTNNTRDSHHSNHSSSHRKHSVRRSKSAEEKPMRRGSTKSMTSAPVLSSASSSAGSSTEFDDTASQNEMLDAPTTPKPNRREARRINQRKVQAADGLDNSQHLVF